MSAKIVSLSGNPVRAPGEVDPEVVEVCRELLERAESGNIHTIVAVFMEADETVGSRQKGDSSYRLVGMLTRVIHGICAGMD